MTMGIADPFGIHPSHVIGCSLKSLIAPSVYTSVESIADSFEVLFRLGILLLASTQKAVLGWL
jgi:hypothetical protein